VTASQSSESLFAAIVSSAGSTVFERVEEGAFSRLNAPAEWLVALCPDAGEPGPVRLGDSFPFLDAFLYDAEEFWASHESGSLRSGPWIEVGPDGRERYLEASAVAVGATKLLVVEPPKVPYEENVAVIQTGRETSLERDRLVRDTQRKEVLLHCIVHDLKGPLSGMVGALAMLERRGVGEQAEEFLAIARRGASRLDLLIQGILAAFKAEIDALESFEFKPDEAPNALAAVSDAAIGMAPAFNLSKVELELDPELDPTGDWRVVGERERLDRVLSNLLGNALRYSPKDSTVTIGLRRDAETVTFTVDDEGPGVPEEVRGRLFQKFSQGRTKSGSAGLGLYFCRITVERWGGTIGYEPRESGGSRFLFTLLRPNANSQG
jgi:signal transduction histidine kinase